jgi:hypothetical protein
MPYCAACSIDYPTGMARCSECGSELAGSTPAAESDAHEIKLAVLARFATASEADMVRELLESNAIHSVVRGDMDPIALPLGPSPATLLVSEDDFDRAEEIYEAFFAGSIPPVDDADREVQ